MVTHAWTPNLQRKRHMQCWGDAANCKFSGGGGGGEAARRRAFGESPGLSFLSSYFLGMKFYIKERRLDQVVEVENGLFYGFMFRRRISPVLAARVERLRRIDSWLLSAWERGVQWPAILGLTEREAMLSFSSHLRCRVSRFHKPATVL